MEFLAFLASSTCWARVSIWQVWTSMRRRRLLMYSFRGILVISMGGSSVEKMAGLSILVVLFVGRLVGVVELEDLGPCFLGHFDCAGDGEALSASGAAEDPVKGRVGFDVLAGVYGPGLGGAVRAFHVNSRACSVLGAQLWHFMPPPVPQALGSLQMGVGGVCVGVCGEGVRWPGGSRI